MIEIIITLVVIIGIVGGIFLFHRMRPKSQEVDALMELQLKKEQLQIILKENKVQVSKILRNNRQHLLDFTLKSLENLNIAKNPEEYGRILEEFAPQCNLIVGQAIDELKNILHSAQTKFKETIAKGENREIEENMSVTLESYLKELLADHKQTLEELAQALEKEVIETANVAKKSSPSSIRELELPFDHTYSLAGTSPLDDTYIYLPKGGEVSATLSGTITMRFEQTPDPEIVSVRAIETNFESMRFMVGDIDFGVLEMYEDSNYPTRGTLNLTTGLFTVNESHIVKSQSLDTQGIGPLRLTLTTKGVISPLSTSEYALFAYGVGMMPKELPILGGLSICAVSQGCSKKPKKKPAPLPAPKPKPKLKVKPKDRSDYTYPLGPRRPPRGERDRIRAPLGWKEGDPVYQKVRYKSVTFIIEVSWPRCSKCKRIHVRQYKKDTFQYKDPVTGANTVEKSPPPNPDTGDPGGYDSKTWADDGPAWIQNNPDGTQSYIDSPGVLYNSKNLPIHKKTKYKIELLDCAGKVIDSKEFEIEITVDENGRVTKTQKGL